MPIKTIYNEEGGVIFEAYGVLTDNDLDEMYKDRYKDDDRIRKIKYHILDTTNVEQTDVSTERIIIRANMDERALDINPNMRLAILAKSELEFGLGRLWETYACEIPDNENSCNIFTSRDELINWIKSGKSEP